MSEQAGEIKQLTAEFNGAGLQISRIGELLEDTHVHARISNLSAWNADLDRLWVELAGDLTDPKTRTRHTREYIKFARQLFQAGPLAKKEIKGFKENKVDITKHYLILQNKEIWLRNLQNDLGKGTKWKDEGEDDWD